MYNVNGFLDKNNDLLFRSLKEAMIETTNSITSTIFTAGELESKKRPETVGGVCVTDNRESVESIVEYCNSNRYSYLCALFHDCNVRK